MTGSGVDSRSRARTRAAERPCGSRAAPSGFPAAPCCDPDERPFSIDGAHCCADGTWALDMGNGDPAVRDPAGGVGEVCEAPAQCCDPDDEPVTIEGAHCCSDGSWAEDVGSGDPGVCDPAGGVGYVCA